MSHRILNDKHELPRVVTFLTHANRTGLYSHPTIMTTHPGSLEVGLRFPSRYQILEVLHESEATAVCRVLDAQTSREQAVKLLRSAPADGDQLARFKSEFATLASLEHPNLVKVSEFGVTADGFPYFTMDYIAGRKISDWFDGRDWEALYDVILQAASALHRIHAAGVLHLDVKPSNLLIDERGVPKLMDFGLALETRTLLDRQIRGTLHYIAPEVLRQERVDARADLYALGMTLYETVTRTLPGQGREPIDVIRMHLEGDIVRASSVCSVPPALDRIIARLLETDPRDRFSSAAELAHAVADAAGRSVSASAFLGGRGGLYAAPLIGRREEVTKLTDLIAAAGESRGSAVIVAGAEGVGKSRVVREAVLRAQLDGARVFTGRCPVNRKTIYAPFFEIFEQLVRAVHPEANALEEVRRLLRPMFGGSAEGVRPRRGRKFGFYSRVAHAMQDMYGYLTTNHPAGASPLILVLEDLQWADPSTTELFAFLAGEARHSKLVLIGTLATDGAGDAIDAPSTSSEWEKRAADLDIPMIRIGPLAEDGVREHVESLLGVRQLDADLVRWMQWESGGSPLHVRRIVDYLVDHEHVRWDGDAWAIDSSAIGALRIPGGAVSFLMERIERLGSAERQVVEAAAVIGETAPLALLMRTAALPPEEAWAAVTAASRLGVVEESPDGRRVSFAHIHLRDAIYNTTSDRRRSELHLRAGDWLEETMLAGAPQLVGQVAYHFARANETERGVRYSVAAGDLASRTMAHEEAADFYRAALELMDLGGLDEAAKAEVREKLADAYYRRDDYRAAMHSYQYLLKSVQSRSADDAANADLARVNKKIGKVLVRRGDYDAALAYFQNALAIYEGLDETLQVAEILNRVAWIYRQKDDLASASDAAGRAKTLLEPMERNVVYGYVENMLGLIEYSAGEWERSRDLLLSAIDLAETLGSEQLRKVASMNLGNTLWKLGEWKTALEYFRRNLQISEAEGDLWDLISCYNNIGVIEFGRGNFRAAADFFEKSIRLDEKIGAVDQEAFARENLGEALEMIGRWDEAAAQYQRCLALEGFDEVRTSRVSVYVPLARITMKRGNAAAAAEYAQKALHAAERARDEDLAAEAAFALALIEEERENDAEAERHLARALSIFEAHATVQALARAYTAAARLALRRHDVEGAAAHLSNGRTLAERLGDGLTLATNEWVAARIAFVRGDREEGVARFETAREQFEALETPYEVGRLLFDFGLLREEADVATETIRGAIRAFEKLGARHDLERARGALFRIRPSWKPPEQNVVGLYEIVKIINSTLDVEEVLNRVLDVCLRRLRAERGMILLLDPITNALRTRVVRNIRDGADVDARRSPQSVVKEVIRTGRAIMSADASTDDRFRSESMIAENILSVVCVPLVIRERVAGAIYVDHRQTRHLFAPKDMTFMEAFADQAAIAIENARLFEELEEAKSRLAIENESLRREVLVDKHLDSLVGQSSAVSKIHFAIRKASAGSSTVLIRGESGTGKGLVARIIHNIGPRRQAPFIKFNCAALPETLAESELFGHEKGAFTGADRRKLGRFELANGGTIFLDEIGKVSLAMQAKLLRVVEEKEFERVGGTQTIKTDVKIITATNLDLEKAIEEGQFREDLYYRLNIVPLTLAPLRERKEDIPLLAEHFIRKICRDLGVETKRLAAGVLELFYEYNWPGNVRELEANLHRAIVMASGEKLTADDFTAILAPSRPGVAANVVAPSGSLLNSSIARLEISGDVYDSVMSSVDRQLIGRALEISGGRIREAARRLGVARNTLKAKMLKYGMAGDER